MQKRAILEQYFQTTIATHAPQLYINQRLCYYNSKLL